MTEKLVITAFEKAIKSGSIKPSTIIHTDCGSQYVSNKFRVLPKAEKSFFGFYR